MEQAKAHALATAAARVRLLAMDMVHTAASGHIGGSLSVADILTDLYFSILRVDPKNPKDPERDRLVLSKGHCTPALYAALALRGYFPEGKGVSFMEGDYGWHGKAPNDEQYERAMAELRGALAELEGK